MRQLLLAGMIMGDEEQIDHAAAGITTRQISLQHLPRLSIFSAREQAVAVDRVPQGLRLAPQGMDDVVVIDDMDAVSIARPRARGWLTTKVPPTNASMRSS